MQNYLILKDPVTGGLFEWDDQLVELDVSLNRSYITDVHPDQTIERHHLGWEVDVDAEVIFDAASNDELAWVMNRLSDARPVQMEVGFEGYSVHFSDNIMVCSVDVGCRMAWTSFRLDLRGTVCAKEDLSSDIASAAPTIITCPDCKGSGKYIGFTDIEVCDRCHGTGETRS